MDHESSSTLSLRSIPFFEKVKSVNPPFSVTKLRSIELFYTDLSFFWQFKFDKWIT